MNRDRPRARLILAFLLLACTVLLIVDTREVATPATSALRGAGAAVFAPVAAGVSTVATPTAHLYRSLAALPDATERISELERDNAELTARIAAYERDEARLEQLDGLLGLAGRGGYEIVPAHAVTRVSTTGLAETFTLDVGRAEGVEPDMTVVHADGLVGRVVDASRWTATVLLVTDTASAVGARLEGAEEIGVVNGTASGTHGLTAAGLRLELLDSEATVEPGQRVVTLGSHGDAPFVPGVPVGTVESVTGTPGALSRTAEVRPAVDLSRLDVVGVVVAAPDRDPRDSVLPEDDK